MKSIGRRSFLGLGVAAAAGAAFMGFVPGDRNLLAAIGAAPRAPTPEGLARDEKFWAIVARAWHQSPDFINLESGYYNPEPVQTLEARCRYIRAVNERPSYYMRRLHDDEREEVRRELARFAGVDGEEVALLRNTTEALNVVIMGLPLARGEAVLHDEREYGSMKEALAQRAAREGIGLQTIALPFRPKSVTEVVETYARAIRPETRVILISHLIYLTGQVLPVRAVADMAHERGVEVICDGAHSFAQLDYRIPDLGCDYFGTSLHKWLAAPLGCGLLWMKKEKIAGVWPLFGDVGRARDDIRKFEHTGTRPPSAHLAIRDAIRFVEAIGRKEKEERLRYLKDSWTSRAAAIPGVVINTPTEPEFSGAIGNFKIEGQDPAETARRLMDDHGIFTVAVGSGVRVTPNLFTLPPQLDRLVQAIKELAS